MHSSSNVGNDSRNTDEHNTKLTLSFSRNTGLEEEKLLSNAEDKLYKVLTTQEEEFYWWEYMLENLDSPEHKPLLVHHSLHNDDGYITRFYFPNKDILIRRLERDPQLAADIMATPFFSEKLALQYPELVKVNSSSPVHPISTGKKVSGSVVSGFCALIISSISAALTAALWALAMLVTACTMGLFMLSGIRPRALTLIMTPFVILGNVYYAAQNGWNTGKINVLDVTCDAFNSILKSFFYVLNSSNHPYAEYFQFPRFSSFFTSQRLKSTKTVADIAEEYNRKLQPKNPQPAPYFSSNNPSLQQTTSLLQNRLSINNEQKDTKDEQLSPAMPVAVLAGYRSNLYGLAVDPQQPANHSARDDSSLIASLKRT